MRIPADLKPGDRLYYSRTLYAVVGLKDDDGNEIKDYYETAAFNGRDWLWATASGNRVAYEMDGTETDGDTPPIVRIERIASKPKRAKVDKWAVIVWCRNRKHARETRGNIDNGLRKLEIRRLEGGK